MRAKKLQDLLGDHHDSVVTRTVLRDLAGQARAAAEDTFTYGVLHERQACHAAQIERTLPQFAACAKQTHSPPGSSGLRALGPWTAADRQTQGDRLPI